MTDLQQKYWTLQEQIRANKANEQLKDFANLTDRFSAESKAALNEAQIDEISAQISKMNAEIDKVKSDTKLNKTIKAEKISQIVKNYGNTVSEFLKAIFGKGGAVGAAKDIAGAASSASGFTTLLV